MPRLLDTDPADVDRDDASWRVWVHGRREIVPEELSAIARAYEGPVTAFDPQFSNQSFAGDRASSGAIYAAAHEWLSTNATGPWLWEEEEQGHGSRHVVSVYVERTVDQVAFQEANRQLFRYRPSEHSDLVRLAVTRGALPRLTAKESFAVWHKEHRGFDLLHADDLGSNGVRVVLTHPDIERRFVDRFGYLFRTEEREGGNAYVADDVRPHGEHCPRSWLQENAAIGNLSGRSGDGDYRYVLQVRQPDVAEALKRDWGHVFEVDETGMGFATPDYPSSPERSLPADFAAYLTGEAETFEAPHLPEALHAWRQKPAAPRPAL